MRLRASLACLMLLSAAPAAARAPDAATLEQVDKMFADWRLAAHAPGLVYGIVADGRLVQVRGLGAHQPEGGRAVGPDSLFRIASMSKAFTALAILKLRDSGKLALDSPAETYVPEMRGWRYPTTDSPRITVRDLLTHTAGFVEDNPWGDRQQMMTEARFTTLLREGVDFSRAPGLAMEYSNLGYATLGRIVTNVSGVPYQEYIRREIMLPLDMTSTTYDIFASPKSRRAIGYRWQNNRWVREPDMADGAFGAMGGIETSASDYARWVAFLLSAWPARDGPETGPVKRSTVREIVTGANFPATRHRSPDLGGAPCRLAQTYGMGWQVIDDCDLGRVITHSGGYPGYGSIVVLLPDKNLGVFAFSSRTYGAPSPAAFRAAMAIDKSGALSEHKLAVSPGLATIYAAARSVWAAGDIAAAPLANNMLLDRDRAAWTRLIAGLKTEVGACNTAAPIIPISAMEGRFTWICERGRISGRVQRAPTKTVSIQALQFAGATP